jgi:hypothetical protein
LTDGLSGIEPWRIGMSLWLLKLHSMISQRFAQRQNTREVYCTKANCGGGLNIFLYVINRVYAQLAE